MLKEIYRLYVTRNFDRNYVEFDHYPTNEEIQQEIEKEGLECTARVEKVYEFIKQ